MFFRTISNLSHHQTKSGQYDIAIKFAEQHIPGKSKNSKNIRSMISFSILGSPFRVQCRDRLDANRVNVKMSPIMRANVLQEILIDGQAAGPGTPSVDITDIHGKD